MKKITSLILCFIMMITVVSANTTVTYAETAVLKAVSVNKTNFEFTGSIPKTSGITDVGGISVGTANNRLFTLKGATDETKNHKAVLYYYSNIYSLVEPKKIIFQNYLLGHANAMSLDDNYLYITGWQKDGPKKSRIMRISRSAISAMPNGTQINYNKASDQEKDKNGETYVNIDRIFNKKKYNVLREIKPKKTDGSNYNLPITSIARYKYDKSDPNNPVVKFIINYKGLNEKRLTYTIATLKDNKFIVSENSKDIFTVQYNGIKYSYSTDGKTITEDLTATVEQDTFYDPGKFYILLWDNINQGKSIVLKVNMSSYNKDHNNNLFIPATSDNIKVGVFDFTKTHQKFEIESLAYIKKDENNKQGNKIVIGCNVTEGKGKNAKDNDSYYILKNVNELL